MNKFSLFLVFFALIYFNPIKAQTLTEQRMVPKTPPSTSVKSSIPDSKPLCTNSTGHHFDQLNLNIGRKDYKDIISKLNLSEKRKEFFIRRLSSLVQHSPAFSSKDNNKKAQIMALAYCESKGFSGQAGFFWQRVKPTNHQYPYALTNVVCIKGKFGSDSFKKARAQIADNVLKSSNPLNIKRNTKERIDLAKHYSKLKCRPYTYGNEIRKYGSLEKSNTDNLIKRPATFKEESYYEDESGIE